jgi:hypothetical protein
MAFYRMSETNGSLAVDETGNYPGQYQPGGNLPVIGGADVPANSPTGLRSVTFSGGQWLQLPSALADSLFRSGGSWTVSFWVRPTSTDHPGGNTAFAWLSASTDVEGVELIYRDDGTYDYWIGDAPADTWNDWPTCISGTALQEVWFHMAAAYDSSTSTLYGYLNGQPVLANHISKFTFPESGRPITVGMDPLGSPTCDLLGEMTDLRLYRGALSAQDISTLAAYPGGIGQWAAPQPLATPQMNGLELQFTISNSIPGLNLTLLSSTNLSIAPSAWTVAGISNNLPTGQVPFTLPINANEPERYYMLQSQ